MDAVDENTVDIISERGIDFQYGFSFETESGQLIAFLGFTATCNIIAGTPDDPRGVVLPITMANGRLLFNGAVVSLRLTIADTMLLAAGSYWFELILTSPDGLNRERPVWGWWQHEPTGVGA